MEMALALAEEAATAGEVPVGAVIVSRDGVVLGRGRNCRESGDPLGHAEIVAIREAAANAEGWRLDGTTMFVTLEPCAMCAGAIVNSRIAVLVFGAADPKAGFCGSLGNLVQDARLNHRVELVSGVREDASSALLKTFFRKLRAGSEPDTT